MQYLFDVILEAITSFLSQIFPRGGGGESRAQRRRGRRQT